MAHYLNAAAVALVLAAPSYAHDASDIPGMLDTAKQAVADQAVNRSTITWIAAMLSPGGDACVRYAELDADANDYPTREVFYSRATGYVRSLDFKACERQITMFARLTDINR